MIIGKVALFIPALFAVYYGLSSIELVSEKDIVLSRDRLNLASEIYDRHGNKIGEYAHEKRYFVPLAEVSPYIRKSFLSAEDNEFFAHQGIDYSSILRAFFTNLFSLQIKQGGSTITQQLARILFLNRERTWLRKSKEAQIAQILEKKYSKEKILEYYLNTVYLGNGSYGVEAASRNYFRKKASDLSIGEAAMLAALPKAPSSLAPHRNYAAAKKRQQFILQRMLADKAISSGQYKEIINKDIKVFSHPKSFIRIAPYFSDQVQKVLHKKFSLTALKTKGYQIHTSLDSSLQKKISVRFNKQTTVWRKKLGKEMQAAFLVMQPKGGEVLAVQGGSDYRTTQFNRALQTRRYAEQMVLPFILAVAADTNLVHYSLNDIDLTFIQLYKSLLRQFPINMMEVIANLGYGSLQKVFRPLDIDFTSHTVAIGFTLAQIVSAFATFANNGFQVKPHYVLQIKNNRGEVLFRAKKETAKQLFSVRSSFIVNEVLQAFLQQEGGNKMKGLSGFACTNSDQHDSWTIGYNPHVAFGVWLGAEHGRIRLPAQINPSFKLFKHAFSDLRHGNFPKLRKNIAFVSLKISDKSAKEKYLSLPVPL